jgi:hypothetical protein
MSEMNTADCKKVIVDIMKGLYGKMTQSERVELSTSTVSLTESFVCDVKNWKRTSKMKLPNGAQRTFRHESGRITVRISDTISQDGSPVIEVEMEMVPEVIQRVIDHNGGFDLDIGKAVRQDPKISQTPKPENYGMFS